MSPSPDDEAPRQPDDEPDRMVQPVDDEQPPRLPFPVVGIGASAGGLEPVAEFLAAMPADGGMAFVLVQHLSPNHESMMAEILGRRTAMTVAQVEDGMAVRPDCVYVIRPGHVLTIREGRLHLGPPLGTPRAANRPVDDFFRSLAEEQRERAICIVMSGMGSNGTAGAQAIKAVGGLCIAQDPETAQFPSMPRHLIDAGYADFILVPAEIPEVILGYAGQPYVTGGRESDSGTILEREGRHLREILALLRTRTGHDFSGYKKPTVLRRLQRRIGLSRVSSLEEYARVLRQSPVEVTSLADDLLIHVTGFFRDPEAWDALRDKVIVPLVRSREPGGPVRGWVTACSSGEEAYSLAMLLVEESDRAGKALDIKIFATDLADRALAHARSGIYPGGIESEISPDRLTRFFVGEDEMYRVRPELRDRVVFAPQNVLQDPPFSRLDIASCRNLLIYLEPQVQQRVLGLLHFGLREGGALFLGSSETISGVDGLFEPIDKKARIFRRVGAKRYGTIDFPSPRGMPVERRDGGLSRPPSRGSLPRPDGVRPRKSSLEEIAQREILRRHSPAAVMVDRDGRIVYYHGDTSPFLLQLSGEPTRELMVLAREGVRGPVRVALVLASAGDAKAVVADGWIDQEPGRRTRVAVVASPIVVESGSDEPDRVADHFIVSFEERGDVDVTTPPGAGEETQDDTRRLREELQSTIEELQASNEEMKASHEEVMSINEELQSTNEELETSKEEMQSLNEELTTVNAQLQAKMVELEGLANDLGSLLASTDIAVLFLDIDFRIRRFTPAVLELLDLIPSDVGRPLVDLRMKFDDPDLLPDARQVLDRLVPIEKVVQDEAARHYLRRVLPYRTRDDRISGVVVAFVNVTERRKAEEALRASEGRLAALVRAGANAVYRMSPDWRRMLQLEGAEFLADSTLPSESWLDRYIPADDLPPILDAIARAVREKSPFMSEHRVIRADGTVGWTQSRAIPILGEDGEIVEWFGAASDVTARMQAREAVQLLGERQEFLLSLGDVLRPLADPAAIETKATRALGEHLAADRTLYAEVDHDEDHILIRRDYAAPGRTTIAGRSRLSSFGPHWVQGYRAGRTLATADFHDIVGSRAEAFEAIDVRACIGVPVRKVGKLVGVLIVHSAAPREWTPQEVALVEETAERTWAAVERAKAEAALREGEERLRSILQSATDHAIFTISPEGLVTSWSPGAEATFGHAEREMLGHSAEILFTPEDRASGAMGAEIRLALRDGRADDDRWHLRKDGTRFFASGVLTRLGPDGYRGFVKVCSDQTGRKRMEDALREARDELEHRVAGRTEELARANEALREGIDARTELLRRLVTVQEDERRRLSRELHDGLGQELTALILGLKGLERDTPEAAPVRARLLEVEEIVRRISREAHDLAVELRPTALDDLGLVSALAAYVERWSQRSGPAASFESLGLDGERLQPELETTIYRVVQEALNNVAKHADARNVNVMVARHGRELIAMIEDDGRGFDPDLDARESPAARRSLGLLGMRERLALVGGELRIDSGEGEGTVLRVRIPLEDIGGGADRAG